MKGVTMIPAILLTVATPVSAAEWTAPTVPDSGAQWMPDNTESFTDGFLELLGEVLPKIQPSAAEALLTCAQLLAVVLLISVLRNLHGSVSQAADLAGAAAIGLLLLRSSNSLIALGIDTVRELSDYGMLLLPVMTSALAAGGGTTAASALYLGTSFFVSLLSAAVSGLLSPLIYIFLALAVGNSALGSDILKQLRDLIKWLITWSLKTMLYIFTGYMGITGVVSGRTDAAALKAAKLTISGVVPVVGNILSDASEAVLVGADIVRSGIGVYGLLAILSVWIGPFLQIGLQYLLLKLTGGICGIFGSKNALGLLQDFTAAMGILLAMTGTVCLMLLISTVCFMKGVG